MPKTRRSGELEQIGNLAAQMALPIEPVVVPAKADHALQIVESPRKAKRVYALETQAASSLTVSKMVELANERSLGTLGSEVIRLAQALILCTLPYFPTPETKISRSARLSDGSKLTVTFSAARDGVEMPFGADRDLLAWLFDKAIKADSPFIPIQSANEYLQETGKARGGKIVADLVQRYRRLSGLVISINRPNELTGSEQGIILPMFAAYHLPKSLSSISDRGAQNSTTSGLAEIEKVIGPAKKAYGVLLESRLYWDIKEHNVVLPRTLWLKLQGHNGGPRLRDMMIFLAYRSYCAESESVIPWEALREQFFQSDSNPWRMTAEIKKAVQHLKVIWPEAQLEVVKAGLAVAKAPVPLLPENPKLRRVRRINNG